ncbi:hypothetical protein B296_00016497 [Ensete ventricosum]|uniref:Uncharacterized protein n=1 Tax=Ensete ventricosum TaxID=4639 RepID=A0A427AHX2_ENSVE|nr:hypothetical protein B296_00016497 [Ensete ventricosum]
MNGDPTWGRSLSVWSRSVASWRNPPPLPLPSVRLLQLLLSYPRQGPGLCHLPRMRDGTRVDLALWSPLPPSNEKPIIPCFDLSGRTREPDSAIGAHGSATLNYARARTAELQKGTLNAKAVVLTIGYKGSQDDRVKQGLSRS